MSVKEYFEERAEQRSWSSLYEGGLNARTYNFLTRRSAVRQLLETEGAFERMLDIGCGTADYIELAERHGAAYYGVDFAKTMAVQAKQRIERYGARHAALVGSGEALPFSDSSFDLVVAVGYIEYFRDPTMTLREIRRVLKPQGILVMQSYKRGLLGHVDRVTVNPVRAVYRRVVKPAGGYTQRLTVDRLYSSRQLDGVLSAHGFRRKDAMFNNFHPFPDFLCHRFPRPYIELSEAMRRTNPAWWSFLAVNYIGKYILEKS